MSEVGYKKPPESGKFKKGDKRINRKGRPKSFDALRELAKQIANEPTDAGFTRIELIMRSWSLSKDPRLQIAFMEYAYGKVPNVQELTGKDGAPVEIKMIEVALPPEDE
jgi:hypothetical protein